MFNPEKTQNEFVAKLMKIQQKAKKVTKPIEAKPLIEKHKSQNQPYLENPFYKTTSFSKKTLKTPIFQNDS